uniref:Uncharacterized protein n=1 Tax=Lepeophtheirus salmonis TaxID=72036 RepID=A0A0K2UKR5_LEPSM
MVNLSVYCVKGGQGCLRRKLKKFEEILFLTQKHQQFLVKRCRILNSDFLINFLIF